MAFFVPFVLGAAAAVAGIHVYKSKKCCWDQKDECSCGCKDKCECSPDCDCGCNAPGIKKKIAETVDFALEKIKSGLHSLENGINEENMDKIKGGLQSLENKISQIQLKLKDEKPESAVSTD